LNLARIASIGRQLLSSLTVSDAVRVSGRLQELEISREGIDEIAGWADGYASKLLAGAAAKRRKIIGPLSLGLMLGTLGLKMILVEDPESTARTLKRRTPVDHRQQRFGNVSRLTPKLLPPPSQPAPPPVSRAHLRVIQGKRRGSKYA
jgi:hypothetical protein